MKKLLLIGSLTTVLLAGCNIDSGTSLNSNLVDVGNLGEGYDLMRDINTGCIYIFENKTSYSQSLTPYFNEEGKVDGCGQQELDKNKYN